MRIKFNIGGGYKNIGMLAGGTALSQFVSFVTIPIVAKLFGPESYGVQSLFMATVSIMLAALSFSLHQAMVLPESDQVSIDLGFLSVALGGGGIVVVWCASAVLGDTFFSHMRIAELKQIFGLTLWAVFFGLLANVVGQWLIRKSQYGLIARVGVLVALATAVSKIIVGMFFPTAEALIAVNVLTGGLSTILLLRGYKSDLGMTKGLCIEFKRVVSTLKAHIDFVCVRTPQNLISVMSANVAIFVMVDLCSSAEVGNYSIAMTLLSVPGAIVAGSVVQVFYPRFNDAYRNGLAFDEMLRRTLKGLFGVGVLLYGVAAIASPFFFLYIFGDGWGLAAEYVKWLSIGAFFSFVARPCVNVLAVMRRQSLSLVYEVGSLLFKVFLMYFLQYMYKDGVYVVIGFSVANAIFSIFLVFACILISRNERLKVRCG